MTKKVKYRMLVAANEQDFLEVWRSLHQIHLASDIDLETTRKSSEVLKKLSGKEKPDILFLMNHHLMDGFSVEAIREAVKQGLLRHQIYFNTGLNPGALQYEPYEHNDVKGKFCLIPKPAGAQELVEKIKAALDQIKAKRPTRKSLPWKFFKEVMHKPK